MLLAIGSHDDHTNHKHGVRRAQGGRVDQTAGAEVTAKAHPRHRIHRSVAGQHVVHGHRSHHPRLPALYWCLC